MAVAKLLRKLFVDRGAGCEDVCRGCLGNFAFEEPLKELGGELLVLSADLVSILQGRAR